MELQMPTNVEALCLRKVYIKDFRGIDELEIAFPKPLLSGDRDIFVMGSKNGIGKTTIMQACSLLFMATSIQDESLQEAYEKLTKKEDIASVLIRGGEKEAIIRGEFEFYDEQRQLSVIITRDRISIIGDEAQELQKFKPTHSSSTVVRFFYSLLGMNSEPLILPQFIFFHGYRKVQEGSLEMSTLINENVKDNSAITSRFKLEILRAMMSKNGLIKNVSGGESEKTLSVLNELMRVYARGNIEKLNLTVNNTLEFLVEPVGGGESFTFDGLSSGQKEIISTLFLIWSHTKDTHGLVLIDEPELHLNAEWHRKFIRHLYKLVPDNQYILATHSQDIFASVEKERRVLISKKEK